MPVVNSVLGPLDTAQLGQTLSHEHVVVSSAGIPEVYPEFYERERSLVRAVVELKEAYRGGIRTIVDVTTFDLGRDIRLLRQVSRRSGVQIIAATGTWLDIPRSFRNATPDELAALYIREIEEGIQRTGIKAGIIKVATDRGGVTPEGEIVLRAAARAARRTGVPISAHTFARERVGEQQVRIFEEEKVDLNRVYIGHSNDTTDVEYLVGLLKKGVWIGLDRYPGIPGPDSLDWETRTRTAKALMDAGYARRIMLSHDRSVEIMLSSREAKELGRQRNPDGYLFISRKVLPLLRELGAPARDVERLLTDNPRRFLEGRK